MSSTASGHYFRLSSRWLRRAITNTRAWFSFTRHWAAAGSKARAFGRDPDFSSRYNGLLSGDAHSVVALWWASGADLVGKKDGFRHLQTAARSLCRPRREDHS